MGRVASNATASVRLATEERANVIVHQGGWEINAKRFVLPIDGVLIVTDIVVATITPHANPFMECAVVPLDTQAGDATNVVRLELMGIVVLPVAPFARQTLVIT